MVSPKNGESGRMVLESLFEPAELRKRPFFMVLWGAILASAGLWVGFFTFPEAASVLAIAMTTVGLMPIFNSLFRSEEEEEAEHPGSPLTFLARHFDLIAILGYFFIGMIIAYSFWYGVLPPKDSNICVSQTNCFTVLGKDNAFREQEKALGGIDLLRQKLTGNAAAQEMPGSCGKDFGCWFEAIFVNNTLVLVLAIILSFVYGAGAIFLIAWNASIIGVVIGKDILLLAATMTGLGSLNFAAAYLTALFYGLRFLPHGLPEVVGYFIGAVAGGIISVAIMKKKYETNEFANISKDVLFMAGIAMALLLIAALIEAAIIVGG